MKTPPNHAFKTHRLILRSISPSESSQLRIIRSDPKNNEFDAIPDPHTRERTLALGVTYAAERGTIDLFVILKNSLSSSDEYKEFFKHENLMLNEGHNIGVMQICAPSEEDGELISEIGGYVHHEFTGKGLGTEAFGAVIGYAVETLGREKVVLETKKENLGLRAVMKNLGLESLEKSGKAWLGSKPRGESVRWALGVKEWDAAKEVATRKIETLKG